MQATRTPSGALAGCSHAATSARNAATVPRRCACHVASPDLQDFIVGASVLATGGAALFNGLKGEVRGVQLCALCQGTGASLHALCRRLARAATPPARLRRPRVWAARDWGSVLLRRRTVLRL